MYWAGVSFETVELDRDERFAGTSGYNFTKVAMALDRIFSFSTTPIRLQPIPILLGLFSFVLSTLLIIRKVFFGGVVPGWTATSVIMLTSTGINLFFLVLSESISTGISGDKKRPKYFIESVKKLSSKDKTRYCVLTTSLSYLYCAQKTTFKNLYFYNFYKNIGQEQKFFYSLNFS